MKQQLVNIVRKYASNNNILFDTTHKDTCMGQLDIIRYTLTAREYYIINWSHEMIYFRSRCTHYLQLYKLDYF